MTEDHTGIYIENLRQATPWAVFNDALSIAKLAMLVALVTGIVAIIAAIVRKSSGGPRSSLLAALGWIALAAGTLGATYTGWVTYIAAVSGHVTKFFIIFPSVIEIIYTFLAGVIVWLIAFAGNAGARRA